MSGYLNKAQLIGNLGADPESRTMQSGGLVVTLSVATSESWRDQASGERRTRTEWHRVVIFNEGLGRIADQYLTKGAKVYVEGMLRTRKWQDNQGNERYTTEIVANEMQMLGGRSGVGEPPALERGGEDASRAAAATAAPAEDFDDDIPF